jgi:uncharacterized protein YqgQ
MTRSSLKLEIEKGLGDYLEQTTVLGYTFFSNYIKGIKMKTVYEIQQFLKTYGTIIYIGDRVADLELMESELKDLYQAQLIETRDFLTALLILRHEIQLQKEKKSK